VIVTETRPRPQVAASADDDIIHTVCCDPDLAMCGEDVTGADWVYNPDRDCALCKIVEVSGLPCPVTGCQPVWAPQIRV
jgi:hypothetical protein